MNGLDLVAEQGVILAVLGPNGACKTTFVRAVATLIKPDAGTLRVWPLAEPLRDREALRFGVRRPYPLASLLLP